MSTMSNLEPISSSWKSYPLRVTRSITPRWSASMPQGIWIGAGLAFSFVFIISTQRGKLAPTRSILLTKARRGTP